MRRAQRLLIVAGGACVLVACNLIAGFESDYSVATDGGTTSEGSNPDGPDPDGSTDSPVGNDGSKESSTDGGTDANFCQPLDGAAPVFCDDFEKTTSDDDGGPPAGWNDVMRQSASTLDVKPGVGMNGSGGLEAVLSQPVAGSRTMWITRVIGDSASTAHYEVALDVKSGANQFFSVWLASIGFPSASPAEQDHGFGIKQGAGDWQTMNGTITYAQNDMSSWYHARITLDREGAVFHRRVFIGKPGAEQQIQDDNNHTLGGNAELRLGIFFTPGAATGQSATVYFDNVAIWRW
jgi:hypothetical protein